MYWKKDECSSEMDSVKRQKSIEVIVSIERNPIFNKKYIMLSSVLLNGFHDI